MEGETRESERGSREACGVTGASRRKQEVAEASRVRATPRSFWRGGRRQGEALGWAGQMGWPAGPRQVSPGEVLCFISVLFLFFFNLFCHCLNLEQFQTSVKIPLNIFMLLNGLFQKHIKCFRVFGNIFYTSYEYNSKCK